MRTTHFLHLLQVELLKFFFKHVQILSNRLQVTCTHMQCTYTHCIYNVHTHHLYTAYVCRYSISCAYTAVYMYTYDVMYTTDELFKVTLTNEGEKTGVQ